METDEVTADWDGVAPPKKGGGGGNRKNDGLSLFLSADKLPPRPGQPYRYRLACTPIRRRKHRWAFRMLKQWPISPATKPEERDLDVAWKVGKYMPKEFFAALVFDRENNNRLRILEGDAEVFGPIGNSAHTMKVNPASPTKGFEWLVDVSQDENGKNVFTVSMDAMKGCVPLTPEEIKALENPKFTKEYIESHYYLKATPEEIKDLWEQLPESMRINTPRDKNAASGKQQGQRTAESQQPAAKPAATQAPATQAPAAQPPAAKPPQQEAKQEAPAASAAKDNFLADDPDDAGVADDEGGPSEVGDEAPARLF